MNIIEGKIQGKGQKIAVVVARFNDFITKRLLEGCLHELERYEVNEKDITVVWVPGAYEIPVVALELAKKDNVDAVICLGAVIKGQTLHFELVAQESARGIMEVSLKTGKPVIFEVLATDTVELASVRAKEKGSNKGRDAAEAALEMVDVLREISHA